MNNFDLKPFLLQLTLFFVFVCVYLLVVPATKIFYCDAPSISDVLPESFLYYLFPLFSLVITYLIFTDRNSASFIYSIFTALILGYLLILVLDLPSFFFDSNLRSFVVSDSCRNLIYGLTS